MEIFFIFYFLGVGRGRVHLNRDVFANFFVLSVVAFARSLHFRSPSENFSSQEGLRIREFLVKQKLFGNTAI